MVEVEPGGVVGAGKANSDVLPGSPPVAVFTGPPWPFPEESVKAAATVGEGNSWTAFDPCWTSPVL